jgi:hypothetical protein
VFEDRQLCMPRSIERLEDRILEDDRHRQVAGHLQLRRQRRARSRTARRTGAFDKKRSRGRIDGLVTIAMGVGARDLVPLHQH